MSCLGKSERNGLVALLTRLVANVPKFVRRRALRKSLLGIGIRAYDAPHEAERSDTGNPSDNNSSEPAKLHAPPDALSVVSTPERSEFHFFLVAWLRTPMQERAGKIRTKSTP